MFPAAEFGVLLTRLGRELQTEDGLWTLRGFVDIARRVYSLSSDTKAISKALESREHQKRKRSGVCVTVSDPGCLIVT